MHNSCGAIKEALACNKMEIDGKERGLEPSDPRSADEVACQQGGLGGLWLHDCHVMTT